MFPATVILLESEAQLGTHGRSAGSAVLAKQIVLNPMVLSTLLGLAWTIMGLPTAGLTRGLSEHLRGRAHAVRAVRHRTGPVG